MLSTRVVIGALRVNNDSCAMYKNGLCTHPNEIIMKLRGLNTLSKEKTVKLFCLPSEKGYSLKRKNLLPFRVDLFSEVDLHPGQQTGSHKSYFPSIWWKILQMYQVSLIYNENMFL